MRNLWPVVPILAILLILGLSIPSFAQSQPQVDLTQKNILILHTLEGSTPLSLETNRGLLDALRIGGIPGANLFFESMDLRRNPGPELRKTPRRANAPKVEPSQSRHGNHRVPGSPGICVERLQGCVSPCPHHRPAPPTKLRDGGNGPPHYRPFPHI